MNQILALFTSIIEAVSSSKKMGLLRFYTYSGLLSVCLFTVIIVGSWGFGDDAGRWLIDLIPFLEGRNSLGTWIGRIGFLVIGLLLFKYVLLIAISPLMGSLSEKIELYYSDSDKINKIRLTKSIIRGAKVSLRNITVELTITITLLLLSLIPMFTVVTTPLLFIVQAYFMGYGNMDFYMERHKSIRESRKFVRKNWLFAIGNGSIFLLLLFIPIIGALIAPSLTATSATLGIINMEKRN